MAFVNVNIDGKSTFLAQLNWIDDNCNLTLLDYQDLKIWKAEVGEQENRQMASTLELNMADYKAEMIEALSTSSASHQLTFSDNVFVVKKLTSSDLAYRIAMFKVEEVPFEVALSEIFSQLTQMLTQMSSSLKEKDEELEQIKKERTMLKERCEKYAKETETLTSRLYAQFSVAFNSLKARVGTIPASSLPNSNQATDRQGHDESYEGETDVDTDE